LPVLTDCTGIGLLLKAIVALLAASGVAAFSGKSRTIAQLSFVVALLAVGAAFIAGVSAVSLGAVETALLPLGLPGLPFHARLDALSAYFVVVVSLLSFIVTIYTFGYAKGLAGERGLSYLAFFYSLFIAGMLLVLVADDAFFFLVSWEIMALSSYFLVIYDDSDEKNRKAALLYVVMAHVGAIFILISFGVMAGLSSPTDNVFDGYTFDAMRSAGLSPFWASVAFLLAFAGFSSKAGVVPLHVWLPEAHPAAPSNVSALMSGVMIKTAIYGIIRISFDVIGDPLWWWGLAVLGFGLTSTVMGILYAVMQSDIKRLLAYSSVENVGIILIGVGLSMIFSAFGSGLVATLALTAALYHAFNHSLFKGLLFMGAGAVVHSTGRRDMGEMGGLIRSMPWTSVFFLVGCVSISALPPFNGFVSEWLTYQAFLLSPALESPILKLVIPIGAALLALAAALAAACFVKVYGVTFLGVPRRASDPHERAHDPGRFMLYAMALAAIICLGLGLMPTFVIQWMDAVTLPITGSSVSSTAGAHGWMWLTPVASERASYSGYIVFAVILGVVAAAYLVLRFGAMPARRAPTWDCGFRDQTPAMQHTASTFAMPLRAIFGYLFSVKERTRYREPRPAWPPTRVSHHVRFRDRAWEWIYRPLSEAVLWSSEYTLGLQKKRIQVYLIYMFATLLALLLFMI
jgi:formate hydrogenlyase subunit 3/multisubunit Na+/H+ antiporter MnhD subunit